ncbi:MAG: dihydrolipoyl dehydrogenase, partial [Pseudomonadota bacterium]
MDKFDLIVIGAGPGGYVSAIRAAQLGLKTAIIEANHLGGICLNWGCIPTKALLRSADIYRNILHASSYGLSVQEASYDLGAIVKRSRDVAAKLNAGVRHLLKKNKVTLFEGYGCLTGGAADARCVQVTDTNNKKQDLQAGAIIVATGARGRQIPGLESDEKLIWSYKGALQPDCMPKDLLVIGSGAIGIEFASFFNALGANVTVVEMVDHILPAEDREISTMAQKSFEKQGMKFLCGRKIEKTTKGKNNITVTLDNGEKLTVDRVISAVGIVGNIEDIGLESLKITSERTHVVVDDWAETSAKGVYAIGDVAGPPWLAHKAEHEGVIAVERIAGLQGVQPLKPKSIPGCTYCHPQIA